MDKPTEQFDLGLGDGGAGPTPKPWPSPIELFSEHMGLARTIARSFKTTRNTADHDDLEQAALLALHRASEAFRPDGGREFAPYAGQAVRNALNDFYRKTLRIGKREAFSLDAPAVAGGSGEADDQGASWKDNWADVEAEIASLAAAGNESAELLRRAIAELLPEQRSVVEAVLAGRTFAKIAEERGVTKQAANNTYQRALLQIKAELLAMGVKGFESSAGVLHETPARYRFTLNSARVSTDGLEKPVLGSETQGAVDSPTAEAPVPVSPAPAVVPIPAPLAEAMPPITPAAKGWWARLLGWWRSRR
jgi:RNA polymerase sigma factor (sigma-70 family)